jgi:hypothetical protein
VRSRLRRKASKVARSRMRPTGAAVSGPRPTGGGDPWSDGTGSRRGLHGRTCDGESHGAWPGVGCSAERCASPGSSWTGCNRLRTGRRVACAAALTGRPRRHDAAARREGRENVPRGSVEGRVSGRQPGCVSHRHLRPNRWG